MQERAQMHIRRAERLAPDIFKTKVDSFVSTVVEYRDTALIINKLQEVTIQSDTVTIVKKVNVLNDIAQVYASSDDSICHATAEVKKGKLIVRAWADNRIIIELNDTIKAKNKIIKQLKQVNKSETVTITKKEVPKWWLLIIAIFAMLLFVFMIQKT